MVLFLFRKWVATVGYRLSGSFFCARRGLSALAWRPVSGPPALTAHAKPDLDPEVVDLASDPIVPMARTSG